MSKFCTSCGAQLSDDATFCTSCGAKVGAEPAAAPTATSAETSVASNGGGAAVADKIKQIDRNKLPVILGAAVVVLVLLIVLIVVVANALGSSPQKAVNNMASVFIKPTAKNIEKLAPKEYWDTVETKPSDMVESMNYTLDALEEEFGKNVKISVKIKEKDKVKDSMLADVKDNLKERYGIPKKDVKDMQELEIEMTVKGKDDKDTDSGTMYVVKIRNTWYVVNSSGYFTLSF